MRYSEILEEFADIIAKDPNNITLGNCVNIFEVENWYKTMYTDYYEVYYNGKRFHNILIGYVCNYEVSCVVFEDTIVNNPFFATYDPEFHSWKANGPYEVVTLTKRVNVANFIKSLLMNRTREMRKLRSFVNFIGSGHRGILIGIGGSHADQYISNETGCTVVTVQSVLDLLDSLPVNAIYHVQDSDASVNFEGCVIGKIIDNRLEDVNVQ